MPDQRDAQGQVDFFSGALRDVTADVEAERQLLRGQKMSALGTLASGVAHDFNDILSAILGASELIEGQVAPNSPVIPKLRVIHQAIARARELNRRILGFTILSTTEEAESLKEAIHLKVDGFLTKPFEPAALLECVRQLARTHDQHLLGLRSERTAQAVRLAHRAMASVPEKGMPIFSISEPLTDAGGDVFRCHRLADGSILLAIADVAGHSVLSSYAVAAYLSMLAHFLGECAPLRPEEAKAARAYPGDEPCTRFGTESCQPLRHLAGPGLHGHPDGHQSRVRSRQEPRCRKLYG